MLMSCINTGYFPQLISWDKDNIIVTGSSDGIVRVSDNMCVHFLSLMHEKLQVLLCYVFKVILCVFQMFKMELVRKKPSSKSSVSPSADLSG